jgi:CubicO group peptidase (beta-lactamase class C family)
MQAGEKGAGWPAISRRAVMTGMAATAGMAGLAMAPGRVVAPQALAGQGDFAAVRVTLDSRFKTGETPGFVALVARGDAVHVHGAGVRDIESAAPMTRDTIFPVASIGKTLTAAAALALVEDGVLGLDEPVDRWLPELADRQVLRSLDGDLDDTVPVARPITLRDLLTMRMGLGFIFADPAHVPLAAKMVELELAPGPGPFRLFGHSADEFMARLGTLPLAHQPGERWLYHMGYDVAGVLIARASGMSLAEYQRKRLFDPLGMTDTGFHVPAEKAERIATTYMRAEGGFEVWNPASGGSFAEPPAFEAGGGGHVSTVDDFHAFGRMLLNGGHHEGRRVLSRESVAMMMTDQITPEQKAASPFMPGFWDSYGWGMGGGLVTAANGETLPQPRFGWWGGFGTTFFIDPHTDTVALLFMPRMMRSADDTAMSDAFLEEAFNSAP